MPDSKLNPVNKAHRKSGPVNKLRYSWSMAQLVFKQHNVSMTVQLFEIIFLYITRQLGPMLYFEARLWRQDLNLKQKMRFVNEAQYKKRIAALNPPRYQKFSQHKLVEKSILSLLGVPTAAFIGYLHPQDGATKRFQPLTNALQLAALLTEHGAGKICFKLSEGWGGKDFIAAQVSINEGQVTLENLENQEQPMGINEFFERYLTNIYGQGLVIEEYIKQHPILNELNKTSVNTLRIWIIQKPDEIRLIGAILRIGRQSQVVDNTSRGGLFAIVDCQTGQLGQAMTSEVLPQYFVRHPDSNAQIEGLELPFWQDSVDLARQSLRVFPCARFVGLDLAISEAGPIIVELNLEPDRVSARNFGAPTLDLLE